MKPAGALVLAIGLLATAHVASGAPTLVALTESGALLVFSADHPEAATRVSVRGLAGALVGIDLRPADQRIYGLTTTNEIYTIDPRSGEAKLVSSLTVPFDGEMRSGIDFNPQADRLRLVSAQGQNLRVNVENGATAVDRSVTYAAGDPNAGRRPGITGAASPQSSLARTSLRTPHCRLRQLTEPPRDEDSHRDDAPGEREEPRKEDQRESEQGGDETLRQAETAGAIHQ